MSKLNELMNSLCPDGVEFKKLGDIGRVAMCKRIMKNETATVGEVPFFKIGTFGSVPDAYITRTKFEEYKSKYSFPHKGDILISAAGTIGRTVVFDGEPAYFQDSNIVWLEHDEKQVLNKYLFYIYQTSPWQVTTSGTIARIYNDNIKQAVIPVPPIAVQREIVRILDNFTELTAELTARKKQYEYYRDELLNVEGRIKNVERKKLGEIAKIRNGGDYKSFGEGDIPVYGTSGIMTYIDRFAYDKPTVLIPRKGSIEKLYYVDTPFWNVDTIFYTEINTEIVIPKYLYYLLKKEHLEQYNTAGGVPSLTQSVLNEIELQVPPMEDQERIVSILDRFDKLCNDLTQGIPAEIEARKKQYEYYRDKLLSFNEKAVCT